MRSGRTQRSGIHIHSHRGHTTHHVNTCQFTHQNRLLTLGRLVTHCSTENAEARRRQAEKAKSRDGQNQPHAEQDAMRTGRERETPTDVAKALAEPHGLPRTVRKGDGIQAKDSSRKKSNSLSSLWRRVKEPSKPKPERFLDVAASAEDKGEFYPRGRPVGDEGNNPGHTSFADEARRQDRRSGPAIRTRYSDNDNGEWSPGPREPIKPFKIRRRGSTWSSLQEKLGMRH